MTVPERPPQPQAGSAVEPVPCGMFRGRSQRSKVQLGACAGAAPGLSRVLLAVSDTGLLTLARAATGRPNPETVTCAVGRTLTSTVF